MSRLRIERTEMSQIGEPSKPSSKAKTSTISFDEWLHIGLENGWCGPPVCSIHDGIPMSEAEEEEFQEGDPCVHIIRLYEDEEQKKLVEDFHSPSNWRKPLI